MKSPNMMMWCIALICLMNYVISDQSLTVGTDKPHDGEAMSSFTVASNPCSAVSDISSCDELLVSYTILGGSVVNGSWQQTP